MPFNRHFATLVLTIVLSVAVMVLACARDARFISALAAALFALQMTVTIARTNVPRWRSTGAMSESTEEAVSLGHNAILAGLIYAWGAVAFFAIYSLSGLNWRHWWQYGAAFALFAAGNFIYAYWLADPLGSLRRPRALNLALAFTLLQGLGTLAVLAFLALSDKLQTPKADWAANDIFITGSATLFLLSAMTLLTHRRLAQQRAAA